MLAAGALNDLLGVPVGQIHEEAIPVDGSLQGGDLLGRDIAHHVAAIVPGLVVVVGPSSHAAQRATFHPLDAAHSFQQRIHVVFRWFHDAKI